MALQQEAKPPLFLSIILYVTINFKVGGVNSHGRGTFYNSIYPVPSLLTLISAYCWINVSKSTVKKKFCCGIWIFLFSVAYLLLCLPYYAGSEIPLQCQMGIQGKELGRNLVKSEDSLLLKF